MPSKFRATKSAQAIEKVEAEQDAILVKSQQEIETWIDANIETLDDVKQYLKRLTKTTRLAQTARK